MIELSTERYLEMPERAALELERVLHALADPVRLRIVAELAAGGEKVCGTFVLPVSPATRSHHLRILREAGVTVTRVRGTQRLVALRRDDLEARFPGLLGAILAAHGTPEAPAPR